MQLAHCSHLLWQAVFRRQGRTYHLGTYKLEEEAAAACDMAALIVQGAGARGLSFDQRCYCSDQVRVGSPQPHEQHSGAAHVFTCMAGSCAVPSAPSACRSSSVSTGSPCAPHID